ncbi:hypothetical protein NQZ68_034930 [Dissostichus eleginoides]|nr:hypothetical protein NQZ68_034930 [Dissostichus eleginoides]
MGFRGRDFRCVNHAAPATNHSLSLLVSKRRLSLTFTFGSALTEGIVYELRRDYFRFPLTIFVFRVELVNTSGEVMSDLLEKIKEEHQDVAKVLQEADLCTDSDIRPLTAAELYELFPEKKDLKLRRTIFNIIHKQKSLGQLLREMKDISVDFKDALTDNGVLVDNLSILKDMQTHMKDMQSFLDPHISSLEANIQNQPIQESVTKVTKPRDDNGPEGAHGKLVYHMVVNGTTFGAHDQLMEKVKKEVQDQFDLVQSKDDKDYDVTIVFCPIVSRVGPDVESAMRDVKGDKPVILILMHHAYEAKFIPKPWRDGADNQLNVNAHTCLYQLTVCNMQPASISYGKDTTVIAPDDDDDDDVEEELCPGTSTVSAPDPVGSNEKKMKRKKRREKRKLINRHLKSAETSDNYMSELPFSLTSPTTWKELGFSGPASTQKKRKRKRGDIGGRVDSEEDADKKKKKKESVRPNYFISIPITNTQISSAVTQVQEAVLQQEPRLARAMIPVPTLHITLLVTHLASQEQVDLAATVLAEAEPSLAELLGGRDLVLPFSGIGHFRKEVVFVGLAPGQHRHTLDSLAALLQSRFEEQGLLQEGNRGFEPHLTMLKLSRASKLRSQGMKRVDPALYSNYTNKFFGDQTVERVDLCSMLKKKQQDGYYHTETSLQLGVGSVGEKLLYNGC